MSLLEKCVFLIVGLGSILYFLLQKIKEQGIALEGGILVILALIMTAVALCCWRYLKAADKKKRILHGDRIQHEK